MIISGHSLSAEPVWFLESNRIENVKSLEILGVTFDSKNVEHASKRIEKCRRSFYGLPDLGMSYPGLGSAVKSYLWKSMCQPVLLYGTDCATLNKSCEQKLESTQGNLLKQCLGLSKQSRSSHLLQALGVCKIRELIKKNTASFFERLFRVNSPLQSLCNHFLSLYVAHGVVIKGTLVDILLNSGLSPIKCAFSKSGYVTPIVPESGVVDSLKCMVMHEHFIKPYSEQHVLACLLTKSF